MLAAKMPKQIMQNRQWKSPRSDIECEFIPRYNYIQHPVGDVCILSFGQSRVGK